MLHQLSAWASALLSRILPWWPSEPLSHVLPSRCCFIREWLKGKIRVLIVSSCSERAWVEISPGNLCYWVWFPVWWGAQLCLEGVPGRGITSTDCSFQLLPAPFDHRDKYLFVLFFCHHQPHFKLLIVHFKLGENVPPHKHLQIQINAQRQIFPLLAHHCLWLGFLVFLHTESLLM